ncbi:MAG: peptide deformylase [Clostridia bacterium]|nr:peptide deformylase [Clostridia bacterium]
MALLHIYDANEPAENELLRKTSRQVEQVTPRIRTLLDDMYETMVHAEGVGLAAPQVGVLRRVVVIQIPEGERLNLIDPVILTREGDQEGPEGCLSVPGEAGIVTRPNRVTVRAMDETGTERTVTGEGLLARALCHEIDHLDGVLYTDLASRMLTPEEMNPSEEAEESVQPEESGDPPRRRGRKRRPDRTGGKERK